MFGLPVRVWLLIGFALAVAGGLVFFGQWSEQRGFTRGQDKVLGQWRAAIELNAKLAAKAQIDLDIHTANSETKRAASVDGNRKIVVKAREAIEASPDEHASYLSACAAIRELRHAGGLTIADLPVDTA